MQYINDPCTQIEELENKVKELEEELSRKDEIHLREFTNMRAYLYCVMQKYLIR